MLSACLVALAGVLVPQLAPAASDASTVPPLAAASQADSERARAGVRSGEFVSLERIVQDAQRRHPGRILEIELEGDEYEVELLTDDGVQVELEYDARTGHLLEVEYDD
ncbi:MAG: PepSY domain-containing protein [Pseudomonadota bacterium]